MTEFLLIIHCVFLFLLYRSYRKRTKELVALEQRSMERWAEILNADKKAGDTDG